MDNKTNIAKKFSGKPIDYARVLFLPLALSILFVIQNQFFNIWLHIYSKTYSIRLSLVVLALGVIFYGPALLFKRRRAYIYLLFISFLVFFIFTAQFLYYRYSQSFLQFSAIKYLWQVDSVFGTVKILVTPELLLFFSSFALVLFAAIRTSKKKTAEFILPNWEKIIIVLAMVGIVFFGYKYLLYSERKEWGSTSRLYTDVYDLKALVGKMGIMNFFLEDTFKYALRSNLVTAADRNFLQTWAEENPVNEDGQKYFGAEKGKNVIIIQVESLETAVINQKINEQEITPNLNQLARNGLYFDNYYAQVGPGNTADAEFSTMNSLYPLPDDVVFIDYAKNQYKALPQLLVNNGYQTYSMHGDVPTFWNRSNIYPGLGYQKTYDLDNYIITRPVGRGPSSLGDEDLFSQSLPRLAASRQPFMATVITMSSHTPFILPLDLQTLEFSVDTILDKNQQNYLQSIRYTDKAIGEFIDGLKKNGLYDNSLILIWGDHGSYTNISSALNPNQEKPTALINSQVPLIILAPGLDLKGIVNTPGSHLDIYPTITNLLGIQPPKTVLGQDLLNAKDPVETNFKVVSGGIDSILTPALLYQANENGVFNDGLCQSVPQSESQPIDNCKALFVQQSNILKASDIIIKGNLLNFFAENLK